MERLQTSEAKSSTVIQSLRQRLTEVEGGRGGEVAGQRLSELHTEIGRLKKALQEKVKCPSSIYTHNEILTQPICI